MKIVQGEARYGELRAEISVISTPCLKKQKPWKCAQGQCLPRVSLPLQRVQTKQLHKNLHRNCLSSGGPDKLLTLRIAVFFLCQVIPICDLLSSQGAGQFLVHMGDILSKCRAVYVNPLSS